MTRITNTGGEKKKKKRRKIRGNTQNSEMPYQYFITFYLVLLN
jgi:hypothetical protein